MTVEFVKELPVSATGAKQCLVKKDHKYYVVSSVHAPFSGFETLVFPADETGEVTQFLEVAGGRGMSREAAMQDLDAENLHEEAEEG